MKSLRSFALVLLCFCLAVSGTAVAAPGTGMTMESMGVVMSTDQDCPGLVDAVAVPSVDDGTAPVGGTKPDCCKGGCHCASAHCVFVAIVPLPLLRGQPTVTTVAASAGSVYSSPALARLVRPPIS